MSNCKTLNPLLFFETAKKWGNPNLCCWETPTQTYDSFITALTQTYNSQCKQDKLFSDYITQLFTNCLSGSSSSHTHSLCCYWTGNTDGSISPSGTSKYVGIGTDTPDKTFHVKTVDNTVAVFESTDNTCTIKISDATDDAYIVGKNNMLYISKSSGSPSSNAEFAFDYVNGKLGVGSTTPNVPLTVVGDISGTTAIYLGKNNESSNYISGATAAGGDLSVYSDNDIVLNATADIVLDATGGNIEFKDAGTLALTIDIDTTTGDAIFKDAGSTEIFRIDGSEDSLLMDTTRKIQLRDTGLYIHSSVDGQLDIAADTALLLTSPYVGLGNAATGPGEIRFYEDTDDGVHYAALKTGALGGSYTLTLPTDDGDSGEVLSTDGNGVLSWIAAGGGSSYWTANTVNGITNSGESTSNVGIGISRPTALLQVRDLIKHENTYGSMYYGNYSGTYAAINSSTQGNTAFGKWTLGAFNTYGTLDGGNSNTAVGLLSQAYRTTGDYNTSVGQASQQSHTTSSWNTAVGYQAGTGNEYGGVGGNSYNTTIGANAGWYNYGQSGQDTYNTAVGYSSLYSSRAFWATSVGALSQGHSFAPHGCTGCTSVGYKALYNTGSAGYGTEYNIAIGYQAGDNITSGSNNLCIGNSADPPSATADYQMNIGGIIHGADKYSESKIANVGIGYNDPKTVLDVHHSGNDLSSMNNDTGGGEVVYFGENSGDEGEECVAGKLMYFHTDGVWYPTDADAVATGGSQLLGICLGGTTPDYGMLIRGFFDMHTYLAEPGAFKGLPMYVDVSAGAISSVAPSASGDYVRVVGYGTLTENVIYFNPDSTWVELT